MSLPAGEDVCAAGATDGRTLRPRLSQLAVSTELSTPCAQPNRWQHQVTWTTPPRIDASRLHRTPRLRMRYHSTRVAVDVIPRMAPHRQTGWVFGCADLSRRTAATPAAGTAAGQRGLFVAPRRCALPGHDHPADAGQETVRGREGDPVQQHPAQGAVGLPHRGPVAPEQEEPAGATGRRVELQVGVQGRAQVLSRAGRHPADRDDQARPTPVRRQAAHRDLVSRTAQPARQSSVRPTLKAPAAAS